MGHISNLKEQYGKDKWKTDFDRIKSLVIDAALNAQAADKKKAQSKSLRRVRSLTSTYFAAGGYDLSQEEVCAVSDSIVDWFNNTAKFTALIYNQWSKKLPNIFDFEISQSDTSQSLQKEFNLATDDDVKEVITDTIVKLPQQQDYIVQLVYDGKVIKSKSMSHLEVITRFF